jgi:hypothetical protein
MLYAGMTNFLPCPFFSFRPCYFARKRYAIRIATIQLVSATAKLINKMMQTGRGGVKVEKPAGRAKAA